VGFLRAWVPSVNGPRVPTHCTVLGSRGHRVHRTDLDGRFVRRAQRLSSLVRPAQMALAGWVTAAMGRRPDPARLADADDARHHRRGRCVGDRSCRHARHESARDAAGIRRWRTLVVRAVLELVAGVALVTPPTTSKSGWPTRHRPQRRTRSTQTTPLGGVDGAAGAASTIPASDGTASRRRSSAWPKPWGRA
jgi:hypothetical protein